MNETNETEARARAAIRVARRLGADTEQLHDVMEAVRAGWTAAAERDGTLYDALTKASDETWRAHGEPYAPGRSKMVLSLLAAMWPDVMLDCAREEEQVRKDEQRQVDLHGTGPTDHAKLARFYEDRGDVYRATLHREAAEVLARRLPTPGS
ncbi:hypothetical protein [Mycobacteroides abscessus]|uniref:hypothetical protein n=1 Tax=Mycobacteroides abscessus TaxID=36809 RepID=UPI00103CE13B|nr:hypothetical protein [Mycobacteroides abscessus]